MATLEYHTPQLHKERKTNMTEKQKRYDLYQNTGSLIILRNSERVEAGDKFAVEAGRNMQHLNTSCAVIDLNLTASKLTELCNGVAVAKESDE